MGVQRDGAWVKGSSAEQIVSAQKAGELEGYLGRQVRVDPPTDTADLEQWLTTASSEQIMEAQTAHKLDSLMGVQRNEFGNTVDDLRGA